jgi:hypothetical protein
VTIVCTSSHPDRRRSATSWFRRNLPTPSLAVSPQSENQTWQCAFFPAWADGLVPRQDAARVDHAHFGLVRRERALDLRHRQCRNEVHGHECSDQRRRGFRASNVCPKEITGADTHPPGPHSSASLRREYLPRTHKCMATVENHPGSLPPPKIWKTSCPDDCMSPNLYPSSRTCDAEDTLCCG